jgi:hypothetical protein
VLFLVHRFLSPWWRRRQVPPKHRFLQEPHGVTTQKTPFFMSQIVYILNRNCNFLIITWRLRHKRGSVKMNLNRWMVLHEKRAVKLEFGDHLSTCLNTEENQDGLCPHERSHRSEFLQASRPNACSPAVYVAHRNVQATELRVRVLC